MLENAAREPEVVDLARCLERDGREDRRRGHRRDPHRRRAIAFAAPTHRVMPDRIETGTYLVAVAAAGGECASQGAAPQHARRDAREAARGRREDRRAGRLHSTSRCAEPPASVERPHRAVSRASPPTCRRSSWRSRRVAEGTAVITETIFENRFMHVLELQRLGADIAIEGNTAVVQRRRAAAGRERHGDRPARLARAWSSPASWPRARRWSSASTTSTAATKRSRRSSRRSARG